MAWWCYVALDILVNTDSANGLFWSTRIQLMACCLKAPNHCMNQCWLIINGIVHSRIIFSWLLKISIHKLKFTHSKSFSALLAVRAGNSPVTGEFPTQRSVTRSFEVFFDLLPNKRLSKQWWGWWFETQSCPLWRHCHDVGHDHCLLEEIYCDDIRAKGLHIKMKFL